MRQMGLDYDLSPSTVCDSIKWVENTTRIINVHTERGKVHDYQMLKDSDIIDDLNELGIGSKFDSGYQGIQKELDNAIIPYKKSKYHELTEEEKEHNKVLSSERIKIEHTNRTIKIFVL